MMMVTMMARSCVGGLLLEILLDGGVVLLCGGNIAGLQVLRELRERRGNRIGGGLRIGGDLRVIGFQSSEVGLRLGEIAGF